MDILAQIKEAVRLKNYALRPHVVTHMLSDGFCEDEILEAIEDGNVLEMYEEEFRCLIEGQFHLSENIKEHLHIVVDYWSESGQIDSVDIVTAYIPHRPFWETPYKRGLKQ